MDQYTITPADLTHPNCSFGGIPRDYSAYPVGYLYCAKPFDLPLMTDEEIEAAIKRKDAENSWLDNIRDKGMFGQRIPSRDQNGKGYCWAHSSTSACLLVRARDNQPYADLSAYAVACIIKGYRDQGGWGSESLEFIADRGIPTSKTWPQQSMSQSNDNAATWAEAKKYIVTEWMDGEPRNARQEATALCNDLPCVVDHNFWSHSIASCRVIRWGPNGRDFKKRIWNSWSDSWKNGGMGDLEGSQAPADGLIIPRVIYASA